MALINNTKAPVEKPDAPMGEKPVAPPSNKKPVLSSNSMLSELEDKIESSLTPDTRSAYGKIVTAGNKAALQDGPDGILAKLKNVPDPIEAAGKGAAGMVLILRKESKDTMPMNAMVLAGATLMVHALDFVQRAKIADVGEQEIATATKAYANTLFKALGVTPQMLAKGNETIQKVSQDPAIMEQMKRKAGLVKAPGTSSPTDIPEEAPMDDMEETDGV